MEREWQWKDEGEQAELVRLGLYTPQLVGAIRAEGEQWISVIERWEPPFSDGWEEWAPDPNWGTPELPEGWSEVPPSLWSRRHWAYGDVTA